jgi:hypothetical protein
MLSLRIAVLVAFLSTAAVAGDASVAIGKLEGLYTHRFRNGDVSGAKFTSTDKLAIVRVDRGAAFFRTELNFFNGHICELSGIAEAEKGALVYRDDSRGPEEPCRLRLVPGRGRIKFEDVEGHCRKESCGARGGYDGAAFKTASRRTLDELEKLKASDEYKEAVAEYEARKAARPAPKPRS